MTGHIDRDELRKLTDAATEGPWEVEPGSPWVEDGIEVNQDGVSAPDGSITWDDHGGEVFLPQNAAFIAAARTAVPALLDEREQMERELDYWMTRAYAAEKEALDAGKRIKAVRDVHFPAHNDQNRTPFCETCKGAPGVHECGCWQDEQQVPVCGHCRGWKGVGSVDWPCATIRALDCDSSS